MKDVTKGKKLFQGGLAAVSFILLLGVPAGRSGAQTTSQEPPPREVQKPNYDYMSGLLSRSTNPLGLKDNPAVRRMLGQGPVAWAVRAGSRHILD
jgi:hypothetical protein